MYPVSRRTLKMKYPAKALRQSKSIAMEFLVRLIQRGEDELSDIYERSLSFWNQAKTRKHLEERKWLSAFIGQIQRLAKVTGAVFVTTSSVMMIVSAIEGDERSLRRGHVVSHTVDFKFDLEPAGERERKVVLSHAAGHPPEKWSLHIGYGGLYADRASRNRESVRVGRYVRKLKTLSA